MTVDMALILYGLHNSPTAVDKGCHEDQSKSCELYIGNALLLPTYAALSTSGDVATSSNPKDIMSIDAFRAPTFCSDDPSMWFTILECCFKVHRISESVIKFIHATLVLIYVSDVISTDALSDEPYEVLKTAVLSRFESSITTRLPELIKEGLGNEKPSDSLRRRKKLLGGKYDTVGKTIFLQLFFKRLPSDIQQGLFTVKGKLAIDELAKLANEFRASVKVTFTSQTKRVVTG
ncbi:uncharacterized protein [Penaeus vannamei]|uniref:uncharacterized protein n=1 Tax=Penaeus vannamei TaxID=6689 RepID=UPI00387F9D8E